MARPIRLKLAKDAVTYHVMTRTAQQEYLFEEPKIREWVYKQITWLASIYYVDLYSVSVMSNHYHIILSVRKPAKLESHLKARFEEHQKTRKHPKIWREWRLDPWYEKLTDLSLFMKELNETVARYLNRLNQRHGHVWGDRFKSVLIEDGAGLLTCMAYVELNAVRAGMVEKPSEYRFCSVGN